MKPKELRQMTLKELHKQEAALRESIFKMKYQIRNNMLEDTQKMPDARKDIARIKTILHEKTQPAENEVKND